MNLNEMRETFPDAIILQPGERLRVITPQGWITIYSGKYKTRVERGLRDGNVVFPTNKYTKDSVLEFGLQHSIASKPEPQDFELLE